MKLRTRLIITAPPPWPNILRTSPDRSTIRPAENSAREVTIIPLKQTNAARVQKILDLFWRRRPRASRAVHHP